MTTRYVPKKPKLTDSSSRPPDLLKSEIARFKVGRAVFINIKSSNILPDGEQIAKHGISWDNQEMKNEIERKFYIRQLPSLEGIQPLHYERYILSNDDEKEVRIQKVNDTYTYEEKSSVSDLERTRTKKEITKEEFDTLKVESSGKAVIRDRYNISSNPEIAIQIYHGDFEGLIRAEVEFDSEEQAKAFKPLDWMGKEMTGLPIARDATLIELSKSELQEFLR